MGYHRAGFDVTGVDIKPQPRYPFSFRQMDALEYAAMVWPMFDAIHASPPCQAYSSLRTSWNAKPHVGRVEETRSLLEATGKPFVIENVPGAPLRPAFVLCGTMFGLGTADAELRRHRHFETNLQTLSLMPPCAHGQRVIGVYGGHGRDRRRVRTIGVYGGGHGESERNKASGQRNYTAAEQREAMGIDWMTVDELSQAIPPAYTEYIGRQLMEAL
jgi:DNA (cytosine-5)-methyltransferase 1